MATVTYVCHRCSATTQADLSGHTLVCTHCGTGLPREDRGIEADGLPHCLVCPSRDLFVRKDFSQRLGVAIVVVGFIASTIAWAYYHVIVTYLILFATAAIDLVLYLTMGNVVECYCCHAQYRGLPEEGHTHFNLEVHEQHRQSAARQRGYSNTAESVTSKQ